LDLRKREGVQVFHDLVRIADVVFNNMRGDQSAKLGLNYECLRKLNARIVCCSLTGYGSHGPHASDPGYDYLMQAYTGYMSITGDPTDPPTACGVSFIDHAAGFAAALGMTSALYAVRQTGLGRDVEISLLGTAYSMLSYLAIWNLNRGFEPKRYVGSAHQTLVPVQTFRTLDGHITVFCGKEKFWDNLCSAFDDQQIANDPRFSSFEQRYQHRDETVNAVQGHFARRTTAEWLTVLKGKVPCSPVRTLTEALADPDLAAQGMLLDIEHPVFGTVREVNTPVRCSVGARQHRRAPSLGEDTIRVLKEYLGYSDTKITELEGAQAI
jgi:crotonobetainyl-CoA:carnitine CoA-transferase CaiB-like acyl-CoA transferase